MKHIEIGGRVGGGRHHPGRLVLFLALSMIAVPANASWWEDAWN